MPEHFRALVIILAIASFVFWFAKQPICALTQDEAAYTRDRNLWFGVTLIAFLAHSFWLYIVITAVVVSKARRSHDNLLALYLVLLLAVPPLGMLIPGVGPLNYIMEMNHYRLLNICLLLPFAIQLYKQPTQGGVSRAVDFFVFGFAAWMFLVQLANDSLTGTVRSAFYIVIDALLPYYVASRHVRDLKSFTRVCAAFVVSCAIVAVVSVFESARHWLLYDSLREPLGLPETLTTYLRRGAGGPLRANVTLGNAIVLGYVLMIGFAMLQYLRPLIEPKWKRNAAIAVFIAGLAGSLSRGPWVGSAAMLISFILLGPGLGKRIAQLIFGVTAVIIGLAISPFGDTVISYLPFVGTVESSNIDYRAQLFDVSVEVFKLNPLLGDFYYLKNPMMEQMRQGQGIIDMVNTYLQIALPYGLVGLVLFCGMFLAALKAVRRARAMRIQDGDVERLGRALIGAMLGILITIATVSAIGAIPTMYFLMAGLCAAYGAAFGAREAAFAARRQQARRTSPAQRTARTLRQPR